MLILHYILSSGNPKNKTSSSRRSVVEFTSAGVNAFVWLLSEFRQFCWQLTFIGTSAVRASGTSCAKNTLRVLWEAHDVSLSLSAAWPAPTNPQQAADDPCGRLNAREYTSAAVTSLMDDNASVVLLPQQLVGLVVRKSFSFYCSSSWSVFCQVMQKDKKSSRNHMDHHENWTSTC